MLGEKWRPQASVRLGPAPSRALPQGCEGSARHCHVPCRPFPPLRCLRATRCTPSPAPDLPHELGAGEGPAQWSPEGHSPARRSGPSPTRRGPAPAPQRRRSRNPLCWSCGWKGLQGARPRDPRCPLRGQGAGGSVCTAVVSCPQEGCSLCSSKSPTTVRVRGSHPCVFGRGTSTPSPHRGGHFQGLNGGLCPGSF